MQTALKVDINLVFSFQLSSYAPKRCADFDRTNLYRIHPCVRRTFQPQEKGCVFHTGARILLFQWHLDSRKSSHRPRAQMSATTHPNDVLTPTEQTTRQKEPQLTLRCQRRDLHLFLWPLVLVPAASATQSLGSVRAIGALGLGPSSANPDTERRLHWLFRPPRSLNARRSRITGLFSHSAPIRLFSTCVQTDQGRQRTSQRLTE